MSAGLASAGEREWLTTREVAELLGYKDLKHVRKTLEGLAVEQRRLGLHGRLRWKRSDVERAFHAEHAGFSGG